MKILIADDSKLARLTLKKTLLENEIEADILEATDGLEAIEMVKNESPSIVFLDLTMPNLDGFGALEEILKLNPEIKVIVVTADIQTSVKERVLSLGAKMMVAKPINAQKMSNILSQLFRKTKG